MCLVAQSCLTLFDPWTVAPPGPSVHGILQARILEWVAMPSSRDLPHPGMEPRSPATQADSLPTEPPRKSKYVYECSQFKVPKKMEITYLVVKHMSSIAISLEF